MLEAVDAVGFICFYSSSGDAKRAVLDALHVLYRRACDDELLRWKIVRCFQSFDDVSTNALLAGVEHEDPNAAIRQEARRSLAIRADRSRF